MGDPIFVYFVAALLLQFAVICCNLLTIPIFCSRPFCRDPHSMSSGTNGMKPCVSLVNDADATENTVRALDEHVIMMQERHGLCREES